MPSKKKSKSAKQKTVRVSVLVFIIVFALTALYIITNHYREIKKVARLEESSSLIDKIAQEISSEMSLDMSKVEYCENQDFKFNTSIVCLQLASLKERVDEISTMKLEEILYANNFVLLPTAGSHDYAFEVYKYSVDDNILNCDSSISTYPTNYEDRSLSGFTELRVKCSQSNMSEFIYPEKVE